MAPAFWPAFLRRRFVVLLLVFGLVALGSLAIAGHAFIKRPYSASAELLVVPKTGVTSVKIPASRLAHSLAAVLGGRSSAQWIRTASRTMGTKPFLKTYCPNPITRSATTIRNELAVGTSGPTVTVTATDQDAAVSACMARLAGYLASAHLADVAGAAETGLFSAQTISLPVHMRAHALPILEAFILRIIIGAALAIALAFAWDAFDGSIRDEADLEDRLGVPVLAMLT